MPPPFSMMEGNAQFPKCALFFVTGLDKIQKVQKSTDVK
jgi:hypothetical protein